MAIPTPAVQFKTSMDPGDLKDYLISFSSLLEASETITSYTIQPLAESAALGLTVRADAPYAHSLTVDAKSIGVWFEVSSPNRQLSAWDGVGTLCPVELTINTSNSPSRRFQRTVVLQVQQK